MKKTVLLITSAAVALVGCQDEKATNKTSHGITETTTIQTSVSSTQTNQEVVEAIAVENMVDAAHNANNALDWNGTYRGTLPCADCEGIDIQLTLNTDGSYLLKQTYQGEENAEFRSEGQFTWNAAGNTVTLSNERAPNQYFVAENRLMKLDINGNKASGELAAFYNLSKQP